MSDLAVALYDGVHSQMCSKRKPATEPQEFEESYKRLRLETEALSKRPTTATATTWRSLPTAVMSEIFSYSRPKASLSVLPRVCCEWATLSRAPESSPHALALGGGDLTLGSDLSRVAHLRPRWLKVALWDNAAAATFVEPLWGCAAFLTRVRELDILADHLAPSASSALAPHLRVLRVRGGTRPPDFWTSLARFGALEELTAYGSPVSRCLTPLPPPLDTMLPRLHKLSCSATYIPEALADDRLARLLPALRHLAAIRFLPELRHMSALYPPASLVSTTVLAAGGAGAPPLPLEHLECGASEAATLFASSLAHLPRLRALTVWTNTVVALPDLGHCTRLTSLAFVANPYAAPPPAQSIQLPPSLRSLCLPTYIRVAGPWPSRLEELAITSASVAEVDEDWEWSRWLAQHPGPGPGPSRGAATPTTGSVAAAAAAATAGDGVESGGVSGNGGDIATAGHGGLDLAVLRVLTVPLPSTGLGRWLRGRAPLLTKMVFGEATSPEHSAELARCVAEMPSLRHIAMNPAAIGPASGTLAALAGPASGTLAALAGAAQDRMAPVFVAVGDPRYIPGCTKSEDGGALDIPASPWLSLDTGFLLLLPPVA